MDVTKFKQLLNIVEQLRNPQKGCPWDLEQTHQSLTKYMIEEAYELVNAIEEKSSTEVIDELGDVLLQVLLHSVIAQQNNSFSLDNVVDNLAKKLVRRHPHVFENTENNIDKNEVRENWEKIKRDEKNSDSIVGDKNFNYLPSLIVAHKVGEKTKKVFDWNELQQVIYKVEEEWQELKEEIYPKQSWNVESAKEEIGDLLFTIVQLARHLDLDADECLRQANKKFIRRFQHMENLVRKEHKSLKDLTVDEKEALWNRVKMISENK